MPPGALIASTILHALVGITLAVAGAYMAPRQLPAQTFRVHLVAAADETAPMRLRPQPAAVAEEENRPPPPEPTPDPKPRTEVPTVVEQPPPLDPSKEPARGPEEGDDPIIPREHHTPGAQVLAAAHRQPQPARRGSVHDREGRVHE
jgi:hypothetical protein